MLSLTQSVDGRLIKKDFLYLWNYLRKWTVNAKCKIYSDNEQIPAATTRKFRLVQTDGIRRVERLVDFYSLEMILAIGYRVRSHRGVQFRRWATERLREYLIKGFVMDDERLKREQAPGQDYFDELLERIRDIRASEKRFYQKVKDICTLSIDYDYQAESTQAFFKIVQKMSRFPQLRPLFLISCRTSSPAGYRLPSPSPVCRAGR